MSKNIFFFFIFRKFFDFWGYFHCMSFSYNSVFIAGLWLLIAYELTNFLCIISHSLCHIWKNERRNRLRTFVCLLKKKVEVHRRAGYLRSKGAYIDGISQVFVPLPFSSTISLLVEAISRRFSISFLIFIFSRSSVKDLLVSNNQDVFTTHQMIKF